jgi:hypothetical protein
MEGNILIANGEIILSDDFIITEMIDTDDIDCVAEALEVYNAYFKGVK